MKSGVDVIRYGDLKASGFSLGPWGEGTASAKGCLPLLQGNPFVEDDTPVYAAIYVKGREAAHVFLYPDRLLRPQGEDKWLWKTDYMSTPAFRNSGAGVLLIRELVRITHAEGYNLGGIHMSRDSQNVYRALKFPIFFDLPRFLLPFKSRPVLQPKLPKGLLPVMTPLADMGLRVYQWRAHGIARSKTCRVERLSEFPGFAASAKAHLDKSEHVMRWKMAIPGGQQRRFMAYRFEDSEQANQGHFLLRFKHVASIAGGKFRDLNVVSVMEAEGQDAGVLVGAVLKAVATMDHVDVLEWCERRADVQAWLRKCGFLRKGAVAFCASREIPDVEDDDLLITQGDGDSFF